MTKSKKEDSKKQSIIQILKDGKEGLFWKILIKALNENIKDTEAKLHGEIAIREDETIELLRAKRNDRISLRDLPDELIKEYNKHETIPLELDPYDN